MISGLQKQQVVHTQSRRAYTPFTPHVANNNTCRCRASSGRPVQQQHQEEHHPTVAQRVFSAALAASVLLSSGAAVAIGPVSVKLEDLQVSKTDCGAGISTVGGVKFSGAAEKATCLKVEAQASNPSGKPLYNADVFGRIYDINGEAAIDDTENIRIAYIDEIPPGTSSVSFKLNVPLEQYNLGPLKLTGFKATGFPGKMLPKTAGGGLLDELSQSDCEITGDCDDIAAAAAIR